MWNFKKNSTMKNYAKLFKTSMALLMLGGLLVAPDLSAQNKLNTLKFDKTSQLRDFFSYKGDGTILVSGHRGGYEVGYAENGWRMFLPKCPLSLK